MKVYEKHQLENEELPFIYGVRKPPLIHPTLSSSNWHEDIELFQITIGSATVSNNGHLLSATSGDVVCFNSNHVHAYASNEEETAIRYLIISRHFCLENGLDTNSILFNMVIRSDKINSLFEEINYWYDMPENSPYRALHIRANVLNIMHCLCKSHINEVHLSIADEHGDSIVKQAIMYIDNNYDGDFSLKDLADFIGVNQYYLSREFHKYTGYTFVAYVNMVRCKAAQKLLSNFNLSIAEISERCGFRGCSYFAKSFRRHSGISPNEYRSKYKTPLR